MRGITLALAAALICASLLAGCGEKPVEPGKTDSTTSKELRKEKTGD